MKRFIENIHYRFNILELENNVIDYSLEILFGKFKDVKFKIDQAEMEEKDDEAYLHFTYTVIQSPHLDPDDLEKDEEFKTDIGDLLLNIILNNEKKEDVIDEIGTDYFEESF